MPRLAHRAALVALLATATATPARAQEGADTRWDLELSAPVELLGGHTTYTISESFGGGDSFTSELEFPLQGVMAGLRGRLRAPRGEDRSRWVLDLGVLHTLTEQTGTVKDSDWIEGPSEALPPPDGAGASHPGKDIFSTSKGFLRALTLDLRASWEHEVTPALRLAPLAGFMYQSFSYVVVDVNQIGYGPYASDFTGSAGGRVATYDVGYRAFYLGVRGELTSGPLTAVLDGWYSPFAAASDDDDHILRQKRSETQADGYAFQGRGELRVALSRRDAISIQGAVAKFRVTGTETQTFYDGSGVSFSGIDAKLVSLRWTAGLAWTRLLR